MPQGRLKSFTFVSEDRRGNRRDEIFYAESLRQATDYARRWGAKHNYKMYHRRRQ